MSSERLPDSKNGAALKKIIDDQATEINTRQSRTCTRIWETWVTNLVARIKMNLSKQASWAL